MHVATVLQRKGGGVVTVAPEATVAEAARRLSEHRIGALLVTGSDGAIRGILSERDIVRALAETGAGCLDLRVADLMTRDVLRCRPSDTIAQVMALMTERRIRHLPVVDGDRLAGIVSIGDVVKQRLEEQAEEVESLRDYVAGRL